MNQFANLIVWQKARSFVKDIYVLTGNFPKEELFALSSQMRRAAVSIVSNIAEGCGRNTDAQFHHFLEIALGSAFELETQIIISEDLAYITISMSEENLTRLREIQKMLAALKQKLTPIKRKYKKISR